MRPMRDSDQTTQESRLRSPVGKLPGSRPGYTDIDQYDEVDEILRDSDRFRVEDTAETRFLTEGTLLTLNGAAHLARRKLLAKLFDKVRLQRYKQVLAAELGETLDDLANSSDEAGRVAFDLVAIARRVFDRVVANMLGLDIERQSLDTLDRSIVLIIDGRTVEFSKRDHVAVLQQAVNATEEFRSFFRPAYERRAALVDNVRQGVLSELELPVDLITLELRAGLDHDQILREAVLFITGAVQNPVAVTAWSVAELTEWLRRHPEDAGRLGDDAFLSDVLNETLRLHRTGSPVRRRRAAVDVILRSGRVISAGEGLALHVIAANQGSTKFGNTPASFNLRRQADSRVRPYGLAFGAGPHVCIGKQMVVGLERPNDELALNLHVLRVLADADVAPDPARPPLKAEHDGDRFKSFPVTVKARGRPTVKLGAPPRSAP